MSKLLIALVLLVTFLCAEEAKDQPATAEQCRTDYKLWTAPSLSQREWSIEILNSRAKEMLYCEMAYRDNPAERLQWMTLENSLLSNIQLRYQHFLDRHVLWNLFFDEDAKGER